MIINLNTPNNNMVGLEEKTPKPVVFERETNLIYGEDD